MAVRLMAIILTLGILQCAKVVKSKSIDEIIMSSGDMSAMDTLHLSPEGGLTMTVELDIRMDIETYMAYRGLDQARRQKRKAVRNLARRWEKCFVYYEFRSNDFNREEMSVIQEAIYEWQNYTCLQFKLATAATQDKVVFSRGSGGCYSNLGKIGGEQEIGLSRGCVTRGVVAHEIGHAIGWIHEQSRPDRDQFIRVNFNRIPGEWHSQFDKVSPRAVNDYMVPYDYRSIMHYGGNAVVSRSIETLDPMYQSVIGQREGLSFRDTQIANAMYNCSTMLCPGANDDCKMRYGQDSYMFKLNGVCRCVCPGNDDSSSPIMPCGPIHTTTTTQRPPVTTTLPTTTTTEVVPMECVDMMPDCASLVEAGECAMNMERMYMYCKKSCEFCGKDNMCMDLDSSCPLLALGNFCDRPGFQSLMKMRCKKSCKFCTPVDPCEMQRQMGLQQDQPTGKSSALASTPVLTLISAIVVLSRAKKLIS